VAHFCSWKITLDVGNFAAAQGLREDRALKKDMETRAVERGDSPQGLLQGQTSAYGKAAPFGRPFHFLRDPWNSPAGTPFKTLGR
jgi:hypothetical protein